MDLKQYLGAKGYTKAGWNFLAGGFVVDDVDEHRSRMYIKHEFGSDGWYDAQYIIRCIEGVK